MKPGPEKPPPWETPLTALQLFAEGFSIGCFLGIAPGLLLGLLGWSEPGAALSALIWGGWYLWHKYRRHGPTGEFGPASVVVASLVGSGIFFSIRVLGALIERMLM